MTAVASNAARCRDSDFVFINVHNRSNTSFVFRFIPDGPSTVNLTPPTVTYTPTEGQTIPTITCSADCNPACTYSWTKDGQSITTGSNLQITNIQHGQGGVYRCTASNGYGSDVGVNVNVIVDLNPGIPNSLLIGCTDASSAEVSWSDGGDSQYYRVMFSTDRFLNSQEVYPVMITKQTDGSDVYSQNIDNLDGGHVYFFKVVAYNKYGNTTSADAVGCTVHELLTKQK
ncbi:Down syndrome cell adhesion molecule-like protein 1 homolog [Pecten maximus]|uniref:Down syndrome cell adhesion molecule-like protein 1 homolog n=1 Tax=Pecten maximus TaxID=6579 RepID=UPI00145901C7|nr:Down syndrome cell adhesion molecule-like protein 1 homolog [Pecten maximus]